jgi:hypothetical protein
MDFYQTKMGHIFFEQQLPQLIEAMQGLTAALEKPAPIMKLPATPDPKFLHDLYFGRYEPEVFKVTEESRQLGRAVSSAHNALVETLSETSLEMLEAYEKALSEQSAVMTQRAYESGVQAAVQMIMAGLSTSQTSDVSKDAEEEAMK